MDLEQKTRHYDSRGELPHGNWSDFRQELFSSLYHAPILIYNAALDIVGAGKELDIPESPRTEMGLRGRSLGTGAGIIGSAGGIILSGVGAGKIISYFFN